MEFSRMGLPSVTISKQEFDIPIYDVIINWVEGMSFSIKKYK